MDDVTLLCGAFGSSADSRATRD